MNRLTLTGTDRASVFSEIQKYLESLHLRIVSSDFTRPWGGFFVLDEAQADEFAALFFPGVDVTSLKISGKLSPKILAVEPDKRLSWQYHHRRAEIWRGLSGQVEVAISFNDQEAERILLPPGEEIRLAQGQRHRLIGLKQWGVVAEIWQHTDADHPSDENDIVRLQDDFGR